MVQVRPVPLLSGCVRSLTRVLAISVLALADYQSAIPLIVAIEREEPENPDWIEAEARLRVEPRWTRLRRGRIDDAEAESNQALELATQAHAWLPASQQSPTRCWRSIWLCAQIAR